MLGLIKRVLDVGQTHRVRRRAELDTSPRSTVELCKMLQRQGRSKAAREAAREGLMRFPYSAELRQILHSSWRQSSQKTVSDLQARISESNSAESHIALVKHYLEFDEKDSAAEACQQMVAAHGDHQDAVALAGEVLLGRFHRDHVAEDGSLGLRCLLKLVELDPTNEKAHFNLAETYYYIGAVSKAISHVDKVLEINQENEDAQSLRDVLVRLPLERANEEELLRRVEETDEASFSVPLAAGQDPREPGVRGQICAALEQLSMIAGVQGVALSHRGLDVVVTEGRRTIVEADSDPAPLLSLATGFRRTASLSAKRMGIGAFEESELCWKDGWILALSAGRSIVLVEGTGSNRIPIVRAEARNFLASLTVVPLAEEAACD